MMVPMADMLNHVSNNNANLEFTPVSEHLSCFECLDLITFHFFYCFNSSFIPSMLHLFPGQFEDGLRAPHS